MYVTGNFCAPEVLSGVYSQKCDVWSIGVIFYMLLSGKAPYDGSIGKQLNAAVIKDDLDFSGPIWHRVSSQAKDLISRMLCV